MPKTSQTQTPVFSLRDSLGAALERALRALSAEDPSVAAHRCRVALKRARALARLAAASNPSEARSFNAHARTVMAGLSAARDTAAMASAARLAAAGASASVRGSLEALARALEAQAHQEAPPALAALKVQIEELKGLAAHLPALDGGALTAGAAAIAGRATHAFEAAKARANAERRHAWRKRDRDRQVVAKALGTAWPGAAKLASAGALGQALGAERDLLLLEERLLAEPSLAGGERAAARVLKAVKRARKVMGAHADTLGAKVYRAKD